MGRFRKTFTEAIACANDLMESQKTMTVEKAAKKAASMYGEDEAQLIDALNGKHINQKSTKDNKNVVIEEKNDENVKKSTKKNVNKKAGQKTKKVAVNNEKTSKKDGAENLNGFEYRGPVEILCFNGEIATINIFEKIEAKDKSEAKDKLYEKLFNNRLPIFISEKNWNKFLA